MHLKLIEHQVKEESRIGQGCDAKNHKYDHLKVIMSGKENCRYERSFKRLYRAVLSWPG